MPVTEITATRTRLHELQRRSRRLVQPEPAELPGMHWAMVRLGSLRAASRSAAQGSRKFDAGRRANPRGATGPSRRHGAELLLALPLDVGNSMPGHHAHSRGAI